MSFQSLSIQDQISLLESVLDERRAATQSQSVIKNGVYVDLVKDIAIAIAHTTDPFLREEHGAMTSSDLKTPTGLAKSPISSYHQ